VKADVALVIEAVVPVEASEGLQLAGRIRLQGAVDVLACNFVAFVSVQTVLTAAAAADAAVECDG